MQPELIQGLGQWRAGKGAIVTDWCNTQAEAIAEYWRLTIAQR